MPPTSHELIGRALAASPRNAVVHDVKGTVLRAQNRCKEAILEYESALASNPNLPGALNGLGWCKLFAGSIDEVIPLMEQALRRSPRDPQIDAWYSAIGMVHLLQSPTDAAIVWPKKVRDAAPAKPFDHFHLAAAYALAGDLDRAATELAETRRLRGEGSFSSIAKMKAGGRIMEVAVAQDPRLVRSHGDRRATQGRHAGGMTDTAGSSIERAAGGDRPELLDAIASDADVPVVEVDVGSQWPGIRRILSPSPRRFVAGGNGEPAVLVGGAPVGGGWLAADKRRTESRASALRPASTIARSLAGRRRRAHPLREKRLECPASADAASDPQRTASRSCRSREHRGGCPVARSFLHRRFEPDGHEGSATADGLPDEVRQSAASY
jgi:Tfp pilus assembly protein PilF